MAEIGLMDFRDVVKGEVLNPILSHRDAINALMILSTYGVRRMRLNQKIAFIDTEEQEYVDDMNRCKAAYEAKDHFPWDRFITMMATCTLTYLLLLLVSEFYIETLIFTGIFAILFSFGISCYYWKSGTDKLRAEWDKANNDLERLHDQRNDLEVKIVEMETEPIYKLLKEADLEWLTYDHKACDWCLYALLHNESYAKHDLKMIIEAWKNVHNSRTGTLTVTNGGAGASDD